MTEDTVIRDEIAADVAAIEAITVAAFADMEISEHTEQYIIAGLRAADALTVSLVAERAGQVIGHVAFSAVGMSDGSEGWYGLVPVSVPRGTVIFHDAFWSTGT